MLEWAAMVKLTAFTAGAALLILELLGVRLLSPTFGSSIMVWSSVIAVFLGAMAVGYFVGGHLGDRYPQRWLLAVILFVSAILVAIATFISYPTAAAIGQARLAGLWAPAVATLAIMGLPSAVLAFVAPIAIRLEASQVEHIGTVSGRIFAISTAGSIAGTLGTPLLIAYLPVSKSLYLLALILAALALALLLIRKRPSHQAARS